MLDFIKKNMQLIAVSVGHFTNDFYMNLVPPILYVFSARLGFTMAQQSMIAFFITTGGTLLQPIIGYMLDRIGKSSYLIFGMIWISIGMSMTGFITNLYLLIIVAGAAAIASSVYHPLGSSIAANLSSVSRGRSLSIFMTIGGFAATFTPIVAVPLVNKFGLKYLSIMVIPGLITAYFLKKAKVDRIQCKKRDEASKGQNKRLKGSQILWLSLIVLISVIKVALSSLMIVFGIQIMLAKGIDVITAGLVLSLHMLLRSIGTLSGGFLSDEFGEKNVMILFNGLLLFVYGLVVFTSGWSAAIGIVILGYVLNATSTANITITHNIMPENMNLGTGMIMGLSNTIAGIVMLAFGKLADIYGLMLVSKSAVAIVIISVMISLAIPTKYVMLKKQKQMAM